MKSKKHNMVIINKLVKITDAQAKAKAAEEYQKFLRDEKLDLLRAEAKALDRALDRL